MRERVILGKDINYSTDCKETGLNNNLLIVGGSGSGKTMSITEPRFLQTKDTSLIATVTKRRIIEKYKQMFLERKYDVYDLNFTNPLKGNCGYDPLAYIKQQSDITFLARAIVKADLNKENTSADPYWDECAISLLSAEIAYVLMTKKNPTFTDVLELHDSITIEECGGTINTSLDQRFEILGLKASNCFAVSCWKSFKMLPIKTASCVFGTLNTMLDKNFSTEIRKMMREKSTIDFEKLATKKSVLFVTSSAVNPSLHSFVNVFYAQVFKELFEYAEKQYDGMLPIPVHVLCDDFATGGRILNFSQYISIFREKQISVTLLLQSESQLEQMYGSNNATTIINNCDTYVYFGGMDLKTAQNISLRLNAPLEEILYLPIGQEIVFRRGQRPIVTQRYDIQNDELYQVITKRYEESIMKDR